MTESINGRLVLISGRSNIHLAQKIAKTIGCELAQCEITNFSDGEIFVQIKENVRGTDVFVIQSTNAPVNDYMMELLIMIDAIRRASAKRITAVVPYFGYARQDRKVQSRTPITAKLVADLISVSGTDRVLTMDLHAGQIQGFFNIPVDHLYSAPTMVEYFGSKNYNNLTVFSPDAGGVERAGAIAKKMDSGFGIIDKRREGKNQAKAMNIIGEVKDLDVLIVDDMVDTAGTLTQAAELLMEEGAASVSASCTHPVLSGSAVERISNSALKELIVTNSIAIDQKQERCEKITVLDVSRIFAEAIQQIHTESSVSSLFKY